MNDRKPTHPGEVLLEDVIRPLGLSITEAARDLGVTRKTLSEFVNQRSGLSPEMALERVGLSGYVRWRLKLPQLVQELAILLTARQMDCAYVWNAHAGLAREEGASDGLVDAMRDRQQLPTMTDDETAVVGFVTELLTAHRVSDSAFSAAKQRFGLGNVVDLMALVGQYVTNASFVNAFELPLPQEVTEPRLKV